MEFEASIHGDSFNLSSAVLLYSDSNNRTYATKHVVELMDGRPMIRPGRPLTEGDYKHLVDGLKPAERPTIEWNDPRILAKGLGRTIWWSPPQQRTLFFKESGLASRSFEGKNTCPTPGLVFMVIDGSMYIYALKGAQAPGKTTKLFQAPFFNVWANGKVCDGNAQKPDADQQVNLDAWERFFFGSNFTHPNFSEKDRLTKRIDPALFWKKQIQSPSPTFPEKVLVDINLTVSDILQIDFIETANRITARGEF